MTEVRRVGDRLILFRFPQRLSLPDVTAFIGDIKKSLGAVVHDGHRAVSVGDVRLTGILTPDVVDALVTLLKGDNPHIERTGVVVGNATFGLQVERMFREAGNPVRQTFRSNADVLAFVEPSLPPSDIAAARLWLGDG